MVDEDESSLGHALRALGAKVSPRLDGYDFELDGVAGCFVLGDEAYESQEGPFTVCRVSLPSEGPAFVMELRPQTMDEQRAVSRGDAIDVEMGDVVFDRAFVVEAAPSHIVRILLGEPMRFALLSLAPCRFASEAGHASLRKQGTCIEPDVVARIVTACVDFGQSVRRLPEDLARQRESAGYRGGRFDVRPEDEAQAAEELAAVKEVRRTRRQIAGANVGLVMLAVIVAGTLYELCTRR